MKRTYFINNEEDFKHMLNFAQRIHTDMYSQRGEKIETAAQRIMHFFIIYVYPHGMKPRLKNNVIQTGDEYITIQSSIINENNCVEGNITAEVKPNSRMAILYRQLSTYVKTNYIKSSTTAFVMAPLIYDDWVHSRIDFQFMFECKTFSVSACDSDMQKYFDYIVRKGYIVNNRIKGDNSFFAILEEFLGCRKCMEMDDFFEFAKMKGYLIPIESRSDTCVCNWEEEVCIPEGAVNFDRYYYYVKSKGYTLHKDSVFDNMPYSINAEDFIILMPNSKTVLVEISFDRKRYGNLSEGMFIQKCIKKKKDHYSFFVDMRVWQGNAAAEIEKLYNITKEYFLDSGKEILCD